MVARRVSARQGVSQLHPVLSVSTNNQSWGSDNSNFVNSTNPWFIRGGNANNGSNAGLFNSNRTNGQANNNNGFRSA